MPITRTAWTDDDGSGQTGTIINNAEKTILYDQIDAALLTTSNTALINRSDTGTVNNWNVGLSAAESVINWTGAASLTVTGIAGGVIGQTVTFRNYTDMTGANQVAYFAYTSASSAGGNTFANPVKSAPTPVGPGGSITYTYIGVWMLVAHEQGAWITPPYSAANFTGGGSMTWTVEAGDVTCCRYRLSGRALTLMIALGGTSVGGTPSNILTITNGAFGGFTPANASQAAPTAILTDGAAGSTAGRFLTTSTAVTIYRDNVAAFAASTNATTIYGQITFEVN